MKIKKINDRILKGLIEENTENTTLPKSRIQFIFFILIIVFLTIVIRLFYVSVIFKKKISSFSTFNEYGELLKRNNIVDKNGIILATDLNFANFYLNRELLTNPSNTVNIIQKIFPEIQKDKLYKKLISTKNKAKYILIKRNLTPIQQEIVKKSGIVGFEFNDTVGRIYPHKNLFSHVIGYVNIDRDGIDGLEKEYNNYLKNTNNPALQLTLDIRIQSILRQQLLKAVEKYKAKSAIGIISEVKTGNIIAMVSLPDFDPNQYNLVNQNSLYNRATYGVYEMGSIFKVFTIALGLDSNTMSLNKKYDISQIIKFGNYEIKQENYSKKLLTPEEILVRSSNVGAALIGLEIGGEKMKNFLSLIGMFDRIPSNFPSLAKPLIPKIWRDINTITISYGHGLAVTPLHIIMGISSIVNNGILYTPKFIKNENFNSTQIINENTSKIMNLYLRNAVKNGTGWRANSLGYSVGGKTGSARIIKNGTYQEGNIMANFVGIFPMNNPYFIAYIMIESPSIEAERDNVSGGTIAAPIFARIIENIAPILNVIPFVERID